MRNLLKKQLGTPAELTLALSGQLSQISGVLTDVTEDTVQLKTKDGLLAADIHNLMFAKFMPQQKEDAPFPLSAPQNKSITFAPSLNISAGKAQTIL